MSILNRPSDGSAPILLVLWRAVRTLRAMSKDELLARCAPPSLGDEETRARKTLTRWRQLGLFVERDGKIALAPPFDQIDPDGDVEYWDFRHHVRRLLLSPEANDDYLRPKPSGAADFTFVCAWLLSSDVYAGHFENLGTIQAHEESEIEPIGDQKSKFALQNDTRWSGFRDWAAFVGFASYGSTFQLDPTEAVEFELRDLLNERKEVRIETLLAHISERIPVLDGGNWAVQARERARSGWREIKGYEVSPALSQALLRLEASLRIRLDDRSDADRKKLRGRRFDEIGSVSHVGVGKGWS